jgi:cyclophilin family peptidyl-prolyl cis-trans isomerase
MKRLALVLPALFLTAQAAPPPKPPPVLSPGEIVAAAPVADWVDIAASDLLVMDLAADRDGKPRRVVIQLMPSPFSQGWVGNIRKLTTAHWWDGTAILRVQDNYVVQWGDPSGEDKANAKVLPVGLMKVPQSNYIVELPRDDVIVGGVGLFEPVIEPRATFMSDQYGASTGFRLGWSFGRNNDAYWPVHCYGMVGVGRDMPPDTGTGAELYTVIGHAPRHLDRNIALVGRVIAGIEHLSSLPRGTGALGFYEKPEERVTITSIRLGNEVSGLPRYQYLSTESASFTKYADARANRRDAFFIQPAGGADICNIPVPIRKAF